MKRVAFKMKLFPGKLEEYKKRHDEIWPELSALLKANGISEYSIFLDEETYVLFAYLTVTDLQLMDNLSKQPIMLKWWESVSHLVESNPDLSTKTTALKEIFYLP